MKNRARDYLVLVMALLSAFLVQAGGDDQRAVPKRSVAGARLPTKSAESEANLGAIKQWMRRTREQPEDVRAWVKLGDALMQRSRERPGENSYEQAAVAYRQALRLQPKELGAMVGMAWVSNSRHEFAEGCRWAKEVLEANPHVAEARALLGDAAVEYGDYNQAFEHYQAALDVRPNLSSYSRSAHLLWLTGDARRAKALMHKAIAAGSPHAENTAWCRAELALMSFGTGALTIAEHQAELALREVPDNPHVLAVMGRIKTAKEDYDAAIDLYRRALDVAPNHDALVALADLYAFTGRREKARETYQRVVDLHQSSKMHFHPGVPHRHSVGHGIAQLARFYADRDRNLDEALELAKQAFQIYTNIFAADTLALCYYKKGAYEQARQVMTRALRWNTPEASLLFHAGMIDAKLGERDSARKYLYQALNLNPHFHPRDAALAAEALKSLAVASQTPRRTVAVQDEPL